MGRGSNSLHPSLLNRPLKRNVSNKILALCKAFAVPFFLHLSGGQMWVLVPLFNISRGGGGGGVAQNTPLIGGYFVNQVLKSSRI